MLVSLNLICLIDSQEFNKDIYNSCLSNCGNGNIYMRILTGVYKFSQEQKIKPLATLLNFQAQKKKINSRQLVLVGGIQKIPQCS